MLKILILEMVAHSLGSTDFFGITLDGTVPEQFYAYPYRNGTEVESHNLIRVYPVMNIPGVETWGDRNNAEEVEVEAPDEFREKYMPRNVRWFVDRKPTTPPTRMLRRHRMSFNH